MSHECWRELLVQAPRANLLQSWPYAVASRVHDQMMSRRGIILDAGTRLGLMQIQEVKLGPVHVVKLHRGPLWLSHEVSLEDWRKFFELFDREFPRRLGRWRQVLPELDESDENLALLKNAGLRRKGPEPYRTILLDLAPSLDDIRRAFKGKWRNALSQAERSAVTARCDKPGRGADHFLKTYASDKSARGYRGPTPARLRTLIASAAPTDDVLIVNAMKSDEIIASVLLFSHGRCATYQAGWTSEEGRACRAHHLLLWTAISALKNKGITALDLGGIHPKTAEGVTRFKQGLGGAPMTLVGLYG
jgi:hypothetical protein